MIMPCMNSTSAREVGGSSPLVDGGRVLLGLPGAPGCTTTGVVPLACWACAGEENKPLGAVAASSMPQSAATPLAERRLLVQQKRWNFHFDELQIIWIQPGCVQVAMGKCISVWAKLPGHASVGEKITGSARERAMRSREPGNAIRQGRSDQDSLPCSTRPRSPSQTPASSRYWHRLLRVPGVESVIQKADRHACRSTWFCRSPDHVP